MIRGDGIAPTAQLPPQIPDQLVLCKARLDCYEFMAAQPGTTPQQATVYQRAAQSCRAQYVDLLRDAKRCDDDIFDTMVYENESGPEYNLPADAGLLRDHELFLLD
jgi:hypothetical protein